MIYGPFSFCLPKKKMGEKSRCTGSRLPYFEAGKKGTEISAQGGCASGTEPPVEDRRPHKPTISTHRENVESESKCGWVEIETHGFSRPSHTAIDFRGSGPVTGHSCNGFIHHTLYAPSTELPKSSEGALEEYPRAL
jgi:hypothetical protein